MRCTECKVPVRKGMPAAGEGVALRFMRAVGGQGGGEGGRDHFVVLSQYQHRRTSEQSKILCQKVVSQHNTLSEAMDTVPCPNISHAAPSRSFSSPPSALEKYTIFISLHHVPPSFYMDVKYNYNTNYNCENSPHCFFILRRFSSAGSGHAPGHRPW